MNALTTAIILTLIPLIYRLIVRIVVKKHGDIDLYKKHPTCYYLDWIFAPFNFVLGYAISFNFKIFLPMLVVSFFVNWVLIHHLWLKNHINERKPSFMFDLKLKKFKTAGKIHAIWQTIESTVIIYFLIFAAKSIATYLALGILLLFVLASIPSSKKIHGKPLASDLIYIALASLIIILKAILISI